MSLYILSLDVVRSKVQTELCLLTYNYRTHILTAYIISMVLVLGVGVLLHVGVELHTGPHKIWLCRGSNLQ